MGWDGTLQQVVDTLHLLVSALVGPNLQRLWRRWSQCGKQKLSIGKKLVRETLPSTQEAMQITYRQEIAQETIRDTGCSIYHVTDWHMSSDVSLRLLSLGRSASSQFLVTRSDECVAKRYGGFEWV